MTQDKRTRSAPIGIRLYPEVKAALESAAKADRRSVASYVEMLIISDLEAKRFLEPGAAE
jgi:hypothetical protein